MNYDPSELFWKNLYTEEDMKSRIVWNAKDDEEFNKNTPLECKRIIEKLKLKPKDRVVDFGCGIGRLAKYINSQVGCQVIGIDVSQPMINKAKEYCKGSSNIFAYMPDGVTIPIVDNCVDKIYSHIVLQHINKYKVYFILKEFHRILLNDGVCHIQLPNLLTNREDYPRYANDYLTFDIVQISAMNFWTMDEISFILDLVGFEIIDGESVGTDIFVTFKKKVVR